MKKLGKVLVKLGVLTLLMLGLNLFLQAFEPVFTNEMALQQMQNYNTSSSSIVAYTYLRNYGWLVMVILAVTLFWRDAIDFFKKLTNNTKASKGEQNHEKDSE